MIVLDTHAWIWLVTKSPRLSDRARKRCEEASVLLVPAISVWELAMLVAKGRLALDRDVELWIHQALDPPKIRLEPLTTPIAVRSTRLPGEVPADPADRLIAATALEHGAPLVTRDERLQAYRPLRTVW